MKTSRTNLCFVLIVVILSVCLCLFAACDLLSKQTDIEEEASDEAGQMTTKPSYSGGNDGGLQNDTTGDNDYRGNYEYGDSYLQTEYGVISLRNWGYAGGHSENDILFSQKYDDLIFECKAYDGILSDMDYSGKELTAHSDGILFWSPDGDVERYFVGMIISNSKNITVGFAVLEIEKMSYGTGYMAQLLYCYIMNDQTVDMTHEEAVRQMEEHIEQSRHSYISNVIIRNPIDPDEGRYYNVNDEYFSGTIDLYLLGRSFEYVIENDGITILSYIGTDGIADIPMGVKKIASNAFSARTNVVELTVPATVRTIEENAFPPYFMNLKKLTATVEVLDLIEYQPYLLQLTVLWGYGNNEIQPDSWLSCLSGCLNLKTVTMYVPIVEEMFKNCRSLQKVTLDKDTVIPAHAFENCTVLKEVSVRQKITEIGECAFKNCASVPEIIEAKRIGDRAYENCFSIESAYFYHREGNDGVVSIGERAFYNCENLHFIRLEDIEDIGKEAFCNVNFYSLRLSESIKSIGNFAFGTDYYELDRIYFSGTVEQWNAVRKDRFYREDKPTPMVECSDGYVKGEDPFRYLTKEDGTLAITSFHESKMTWGNLTVPATSPFYGTPITEIRENAFREMYHVDEIIISEGITTICSYAFDTENVLEITIPSTVTTVESVPFVAAYKLLHVINKSSLDLSFLYLTNDLSREDWRKIAEENFEKRTTKHLVEVVKDRSEIVHPLVWDENGICTIDDGADVWFVGARFEGTSLDLSEYTFTKMGPHALSHQYNLEYVTFPGTSDVSNSAMYYCYNVKKVVVCEGATSIGRGAFNNCTSLEELVLPDSVTSVGMSALWECDSLKTVYLGSGISFLEEEIVMGPDRLKIVYHGTMEQWLRVLQKNPWIKKYIIVLTVKYTK